MRRIVILFLIILLTKTTCFSLNISKTIPQDSTVLITSDQLKYANLIFVEHDKLLKENDLLNEQIHNYQVKTDYLLEVDSLRTLQIENLNKDYTKQIESLNEDIRKKNRVLNCWKIGGITVSVGLILLLFLK